MSNVKVAYASDFNPWDASIFPQSKTSFDKAALPEEWTDLVKLCYFFYEREGLVRTVIDKQVEIAINNLVLIQTEPSQERYMEVFEYAKNSLTGFLAQAATEYYLSGLVIPDIVFRPIAKDISGLKKDYLLPADIWVRNPLQIELRKTSLPNRVVPIWKIGDDEASFINNKGKYTDGTEDKETYEMLLTDYRDFVRLVQKGETSFPLLDHFVIRRKPLLRTPYPIPYLQPALELLMHKRNLRKMDYAITSRVINAILHIRVGNNDFPLGEDDTDILEELERQFKNRGSVNTQERILELFSNHTVDINWITPPSDILLNTEKYVELNQEILYSLGFPKFLVTGEKDKSNTGSSGSALLSPLNSMNALRRDFEDFLAYLFKKIAEKNGIKRVPRVQFAPLNLVELDRLLELSLKLAEQGIVSKSSVANLAGFDFAAEQYLRQKDNALQTELFGATDEQNTTDVQPDTNSGDSSGVEKQPSD